MQRNTQQRLAIRNVLDRAKRPLSPQEILERAQREVRGLGIATVYRTLNSFLERGDVIAVQLPGEASRYEVAGKKHHHHFRCRKCSKVYMVHGCLGTGETITPPGFKLEGHELLLFGLCSDCVGTDGH